jgi:hypothetical protein
MILFYQYRLELKVSFLQGFEKLRLQERENELKKGTKKKKLKRS